MEIFETNLSDMVFIFLKMKRKAHWSWYDQIVVWIESIFEQ